MRVWVRTRRVTVAVAAAVVVAVAGGVAYATIPDSGGVITGCYNNKTGALRVVDADAGADCLPAETPLRWSQQGPSGPTGPAGPQGPPGGSGLSVYIPSAEGGQEFESDLRIPLLTIPGLAEVRGICDRKFVGNGIPEWNYTKLGFNVRPLPPYGTERQWKALFTYVPGQAGPEPQTDHPEWGLIRFASVTNPAEWSLRATVQLADLAGGPGAVKATIVVSADYLGMSERGFSTCDFAVHAFGDFQQ